MKSILPSLVVAAARIGDNEGATSSLRETALPREARKLEGAKEFIKREGIRNPRETRKRIDQSARSAAIFLNIDLRVLGAGSVFPLLDFSTTAKANIFETEKSYRGNMILYIILPW